MAGRWSVCIERSLLSLLTPGRVDISYVEQKNKNQQNKNKTEMKEEKIKHRFKAAKGMKVRSVASIFHTLCLAKILHRYHKCRFIFGHRLHRSTWQFWLHAVLWLLDTLLCSKSLTSLPRFFFFFFFFFFFLTDRLLWSMLPSTSGLSGSRRPSSLCGIRAKLEKKKTF